MPAPRRPSSRAVARAIDDVALADESQGEDRSRPQLFVLEHGHRIDRCEPACWNCARKKSRSQHDPDAAAECHRVERMDGGQLGAREKRNRDREREPQRNSPQSQRETVAHDLSDDFVRPGAKRAADGHFA